MRFLSTLGQCAILFPWLGSQLTYAETFNLSDENPAASVDTENPEATAEKWASLVVQVYDRDAASEALIEQAKQQGGWFSSLTDDQVSFRIPSDELNTFIEYARSLGTVAARDYNSQDRSTELADLRTRLQGREEILARYMEVLEDARSGAVVRVEQQITRSIAEIEQIKGRILFLENRVQYAQVQIHFQFRDRSAPVRTGRSSFRWINQLNLSDLLSDFHNRGAGYAPAKGLKAPVPEGFAAYHQRNRIRATSPDGVVYRVRTQKNKPEADLPFWEEAMRMRMLEAGYHLVQEERIQSGDREGALLELGAADGEKDQSYLIVVFVDGKRLIVVEAAGEVERFGPRREAILSAIRSSF